jgi:6-phosphogluconolactonase
MLEEIQKLIAKDNIFSHHNQGILVARVQDTHQGFTLAKDALYEVANNKSILYLSGGKTPKELYEKIAKEEQLETGAVGLIDERYGEKWHQQSNEQMLRESGVLRYLEIKDTPFYPILIGDNAREQTAEMYDQKVREFSTLYQKSIGLLGIGLDGHTAGIAGNRPDFTNPMFEPDKKHLYVSDFDDQKGMYKERISMTFLGLSMLDLHIVLVFGDDKKEALDKMFTDGSEEEIPSRFFKRPEIASKTILITDLEV